MSDVIASTKEAPQKTSKAPRKPRGPNKPKKVLPAHKEGVHAVIVEGKKVNKNIKWCGEYVRVKVYHEASNPKGGMFEFGSGELPRFFVSPNVECIMPIEIFNGLKDTTTEVLDCDMDNARQGRGVEYGTRLNVRIPYQFIGKATEEEYKAQMREQALLPVYKPLK